jgi:hypothetical protein
VLLFDDLNLLDIAFIGAPFMADNGADALLYVSIAEVLEYNADEELGINYAKILIPLAAYAGKGDLHTTMKYMGAARSPALQVMVADMFTKKESGPSSRSDDDSGFKIDTTFLMMAMVFYFIWQKDKG